MTLVKTCMSYGQILLPSFDLFCHIKRCLVYIYIVCRKIYKNERKKIHLVIGCKDLLAWLLRRNWLTIKANVYKGIGIWCLAAGSLNRRAALLVNLEGNEDRWGNGGRTWILGPHCGGNGGSLEPLRTTRRISLVHLASPAGAQKIFFVCNPKCLNNNCPWERVNIFWCILQQNPVR